MSGNGREFEDRSFNDFCQGYLLGIEENQANCQQNIGMETEQACGAPNDFSMSPEDALGGSLLGANPEAAFDGGFFGANPQVSVDEGFFGANPEDFQAGNLLFEQHVNAQSPLTLADPSYSHPASAWEGSTSPGSLRDLVSNQFADAARQDPLVPAQSGFLPTTANGFSRMNGRVEDLFIRSPKFSDEPCDLALSPTETQPPPPSPEKHTIPCGREECHICLAFSLPF